MNLYGIIIAPPN